MKTYSILATKPFQPSGVPVATVTAENGLKALREFQNTLPAKGDYKYGVTDVDDFYMYSTDGRGWYYWEALEKMVVPEGYTGMPIKTLIMALQYQLNRGADFAFVKGTLLTDMNNTVLLSTEPQI